MHQVLVSALVVSCAWTIAADVAEAAPPQITGATVTAVTSTSAILEVDVNPQGKLTRYHFEYGTTNCASNPCTSIPIPEGEIPAGSSPVRVAVMLEGLAPATIYNFLAAAKNGDGGVIKGLDRVFATRGAPFEGLLPDARAYEQSSPVDKDGGDALGKMGLVKAADDGSGITFNSTFGIPGGKGAQALPTYLATRGEEETWMTQGLLPPPIFGERARVLGWLPDLSETFSNATKLGNPRTKALISLSTKGAPATIISPYTAQAEYSYAGAGGGASVIFFESPAKLPPKEGEGPIEAAVEGKSNLYAWDRASGRLSLAGILNDGKAPPKGAFAGPYDWSKGITTQTLREGGAARGYYLQGTHAITASGDVYFTESGTGQIYLRLNPTQPQSTVVAGKCTDEGMACTIHISASRRTPPDPAGTQPTAFQAASADGSEAFFTSPEKLTDNANTGPEQPAPAIGIGSSSTGGIENPAFIPKRAVGVVVDSGHVYWADPAAGRIGRADLDGSKDSIEDDFIVPGPSECEEEVEPGVFEPVVAPSKPRFVAVDSGNVFWTNSGKLDENGEPADRGGTIGRSGLDSGGNPVKVEPGFICGASNPRGIAVNATHIYWTNAGRSSSTRTVGRAAIDGGEVEHDFFDELFTNATVPYGLALSPTHVYFSHSEEANNNGYLGRVPLEGGKESLLGIGKAGIRGVAVDASRVYWATQSEEAIGSINLTDFPEEAGGCAAKISCDKEFVDDIEGKLFGLAVDAEHLYWSVNGESPSNPGNDLYRYEPATDTLEDLTPLPEGNGAEVQGVVALSDDGSYLYFAANGDLDGGGEATKGNCHGSVVSTTGICNLYLRHEGATTFVARLRGSDALDWTGTALELTSTASNTPKTAFLSSDGQTLLFRSQEKLTEYDNEGVPEFYRYSAGGEELACVSCPPSGEAVGKGPKLGSIAFPGEIGPPMPSAASLPSRNFSADGNRAFFETAEALVPMDGNETLDVYEWEAPNAGTCTKGAPGYSALNEGCVYLISTGKDTFPSYFADASETGNDVFFFTRQQLVGQDQDELQDVYDARVGGGLASQNPIAPQICTSVEACRGSAQTPPAESPGGSATFVGPGDPVGKHKKQKAGKQDKGKKKHKKQKRAHAKRRQAGV